MTGPVDNGLHTVTRLSPPATGSEELPARAGEGAGPPPYGHLPAPPAPPALSRQALREQRSQATKQLRSSTFSAAVRWVSSQHRAWYWFFGVVGVLFVGSLFALWFTAAMVRATRVDATAAGPTATSIVYRNGIPNPLKRVKLAPDAATILGAHDVDGDGKMDELDNVKSSDALVAILQATDLCAWFISVDAQFKPVLVRTPSPGARPLATCADPLPTPTTTAVPTTTVAPTTTTVPAK